MSLTFDEAVDEMNSLFFEAVEHLGYVIFWDNVREERDKDQDPYFSFMIRHADSVQRTLGGIGNRVFERTGTIFVMIYVPIGNGLSEAYQLAKTASDAFEGKTSPKGIRFYRTRMQENDRDGQFYQVNVLVDFEYDEIK